MSSNGHRSTRTNIAEDQTENKDSVTSKNACHKENMPLKNPVQAGLNVETEINKSYISNEDHSDTRKRCGQIMKIFCSKCVTFSNFSMIYSIKYQKC